MVIGGLWHGASWTFIAWGTFHGMLLCLYRPFEKKPVDRSARPPWVVTLLAAAVMFQLICFGWLLFRAENIGQVVGMLRQVFSSFRMTPFAGFSLGMMLFICLPFLIYEYWVDRKQDMLAIVRAHWMTRGLFYSYLVLMLLIFPAETAHEFIYFQF